MTWQQSPRNLHGESWAVFGAVLSRLDGGVVQRSASSRDPLENKNEERPTTGSCEKQKTFYFWSMAILSSNKYEYVR